jgi:7,8-dihydro-6-hydroxymethylpterin-pyrophosphokinase
MRERRFVLAPLAEAWPGAVIPGHGRVEELVEAVVDQAARVIARAGEWG